MVWIGSPVAFGTVDEDGTGYIHRCIIGPAFSSASQYEVTLAIRKTHPGM